MRISDWSSDVCSSDLPQTLPLALSARADNSESWCRAELLRARGEQLLAGDASQTATAESLFDRALDLARAQQALSWELRAANSMARMRRSEEKTSELQSLMRTSYAAFRLKKKKD